MALAARHAVAQGLATPRPRLPKPSVRAFGVGSAAVFVLLLVDALINPLAFFDLATMKAVQGVDLAGQRPVIDTVADLTGSTGAVGTWALVMLTFVLARWWIAALGAMTLPIGGVLNYAFGELLVARTRPHLAELERSSSNFEERSFPSGHVMGAVMLYGFVFVVARRIRYRALRLAVQGGSLAIIAVVGFGRIWTGAHWPTDVLAAYALGGLLLAGLLAVYFRLDAAVGHLPLFRAGVIAHDEGVPHAHALTSLVRFDGDSVTKTYAPGLVPTALYWLAFQAPFPYVRNRTALQAAVERRNLARHLTRYWYGAPRVARATGIVVAGDRLALVSERVAGHEPTDKAAAKAFLRDLRGRFEEAGLPTWQIDPRQPRAVDNLLETADGGYQIVDLESGLVSPMASLRTWGRAVNRGLVPFFDEVFFDVTRGYVAREEAAMRATLGDDGFADLTATLDAAEREAAAWHAGEPRLWGRLLRAVRHGFYVRTWKARFQARLAGGHEKGLAWIERAIATWEDEGRVSAAEAEALRAQVAAPTFQAMLPYLGAHILVSIPLRFPFGSIARALMVAGAFGAATGRLLARRIDREAWKLAWSIHSPLVFVLSAIPGFGTFAYLAAKPVRANRLLLRALGDAAMQKAPWDLYQRSGLRRFVARPRGNEEATPAPRLVVLPPAPQPLAAPALTLTPVSAPVVPLAPAAAWRVEEPAAAACWD